MIKWYWLWRLRRARQRLQRAAAALDITNNVTAADDIVQRVEWALAHCEFVRLLNKCNR